MQRSRYGVVLGRFQPFHIGHMEYVARAKDRCERLVIGITNPNIGSLRHHSADPIRSKTCSNPFPYFVRHEAIEAALLNVGWPSTSFCILPADIDDLATLPAVLPRPADSVVYATIYDAWGEEKVRRLTSLGFAVEVLWRREMRDRVTSGTEVRRCMATGEPWSHLVPEGAARILSRHLTANPPTQLLAH